MKYKITPGNIFCLFLIVYSLFKGMTFPVYAIPVALLGILIDFVIQVLFKKYLHILFVEIPIILLLIIKFG
jgi:hypothetical protein